MYMEQREFGSAYKAILADVQQGVLLTIDMGDLQCQDTIEASSINRAA